MQRQTIFFFAGMFVLASMLFLTGGYAIAADAAPAPVEIKIDNFSFGPMSVTVPTGTEITWVNRDDIPHTVVSEDTKTFKSRPLDTDEKFTFKFDKPGTYNYFCSIHPKMMAKVVVQ